MLFDRVAGVRHLDGGQFLGSKELHLLFVILLQHLDERLVTLHVDGAIFLDARMDALHHQGRPHLDGEKLVVLRVMSQSDAHSQHPWRIVHIEHPLGNFMLKGRHADQ